MENNSHSGIVIPDVNLKDEKSLKEAFEKAKRIFLDLPRFDAFIFDNQTTYWTAVLVLFTGHDESGQPLPPGFSYETGVTVGGVNVTSHSAQRTTLQPQVKVQATRVKCSAQCRRDDGVEQQINFPDRVAPAGKFFVQITFGIKDAAKQNISEAQLELLDNTGEKYFVKAKV